MRQIVLPEFHVSLPALLPLPLGDSALRGKQCVPYALVNQLEGAQSKMNGALTEIGQ